MNRRWSDEALSFAESVRGALDRLGGVEFTRQAEADPDLRQTRLRPVIEQLGFADIEMLDNGADAQAAAAGVQAAGACAMPWPIAGQMARLRDGDEVAVYLSLGAPSRLEHLDLFQAAAVIELRTRRPMTVSALGGVRRMPLDPFGVACRVASDNGTALSSARVSRTVDAHIILSAYYALGALSTATTLAAAYANERHQFGRRIGEFGAIQWRLSDIVVARDGLAEIAGYTLWRFCESTITPADTIALRLAMLEAAETILANSHQIFGAIGLCEEHDLTVLDRHLQSLLRRAGGAAATSRILRDAIVEHGFDGVFPVRPLAERSRISA